MEQLNFDSYIDGAKELIYCPLTSDYHWIRITSGHTPKGFEKRAHFTLHGMDYFYEDTAGKEELLNSFNGEIKKITWEEGTGYGKSENEQSDEATSTGNASG